MTTQIAHEETNLGQNNDLDKSKASRPYCRKRCNSPYLYPAPATNPLRFAPARTPTAKRFDRHTEALPQQYRIAEPVRAISKEVAADFGKHSTRGSARHAAKDPGICSKPAPVSYTHLTLPTIYSV